MQVLYNATEHELHRHRGHSASSPLTLEGLGRSDALAHDLEHIDIETQPQHGLKPATAAYVQSLHEQVIALQHQ